MDILESGASLQLKHDQVFFGRFPLLLCPNVPFFSCPCVAFIFLFAKLCYFVLLFQSQIQLVSYSIVRWGGHQIVGIYSVFVGLNILIWLWSLIWRNVWYWGAWAVFSFVLHHFSCVEYTTSKCWWSSHACVCNWCKLCPISCTVLGNYMNKTFWFRDSRFKSISIGIDIIRISLMWRSIKKLNREKGVRGQNIIQLCVHFRYVGFWKCFWRNIFGVLSLLPKDSVFAMVIIEISNNNFTSFLRSCLLCRLPLFIQDPEYMELCPLREILFLSGEL